MLLIIKTLVHCSEKQLAERLPMMVSIFCRLRCYNSRQLYDNSVLIIQLQAAALHSLSTVHCAAQQEALLQWPTCGGRSVRRQVWILNIMYTRVGVGTSVNTSADIGLDTYPLVMDTHDVECRSYLYCVDYHLRLVIGADIRQG